MRKIIFMFVIAVLIVPIFSAAEIEVKDSFSQGETFIAKLSGNFLDSVLHENVVFYRGHVKTSVDHEIKKVSGDYYIYGQLFGKNEGNYSISIEDVRYRVAFETKDDDIKKNFTISNETASFSVNPGAVSTDSDFSIELTNLETEEITVKLRTVNESKAEDSEKGFFSSFFENAEDSVSYEKSIDIRSGDSENINFDTSDFSSGVQFIELSSGNTLYNIPVEVFKKEDSQKDTLKSFSFEMSEINVTVPSGENATRIVYIKNTGDSPINNITLSISDSLKPYVTISENNISGIEENSSKKIAVFFNPESEEINLEGQITAKSNDNIFAYLQVFFHSVPSFVPKGNKTISDTCRELDGNLCSQNQTCSGEVKYASDGVCCIGSCRQKSEGSSGVLIGWGIVIIVIGFLAWFYLKRYKRIDKKNIDLFKFARKRK